MGRFSYRLIRKATNIGYVVIVVSITGIVSISVHASNTRLSKKGQKISTQVLSYVGYCVMYNTDNGIFDTLSFVIRNIMHVYFRN